MIKLHPNVESLSPEQLQILQGMWRKAADAILHATSLAACGHPGGSLSSIHFLLVLYAIANIRPENRTHPARDRIVISHGHISPGVYAALAQFGFFDMNEMILHFRKLGSRYGGHVESGVPGVEWNTGNLGQGPSAAVGMALAGKIKGTSYKTIVCMGDGEQQKGQIAEARRTAVKFGLSNLLGIVDYNEQQIGGHIKDIMPQDIRAGWAGDGWNIIDLENGNDFNEVYRALRRAWLHDVPCPEAPTVILASTRMGFGVSFMEGSHDFHGKACTAKEHSIATQELDLPDRLEDLQRKRKALPPDSTAPEPFQPPAIKLDPGEATLYEAAIKTDNRSAFGHALLDLAKRNNDDEGKATILGISCDLEGSVKMNDFHKAYPRHFLECGIQEHNNCVVAGSLSREGFQVFFSTFGVFGVDEVYNQQRLNAFNHTNLKTVCTHVGLNVGEDGPTHQCLDYIGLLRNVFHTSILIPADPNQTDHLVRYAASHYGNFFIGMGRAKTAVITDEAGTPFYGKSYRFVPGKADILRKGSDATVFAIGPMVEQALKASQTLREQSGLGIRVVNFASVVPWDTEAVKQAALETGVIVTVEDHHRDTGIGAIISQILADAGIAVPLIRLGVTRFASSGTPNELYTVHGLDASHIEATLMDGIRRKQNQKR